MASLLEHICDESLTQDLFECNKRMELYLDTLFSQAKDAVIIIPVMSILYGLAVRSAVWNAEFGSRFVTVFLSRTGESILMDITLIWRWHCIWRAKTWIVVGIVVISCLNNGEIESGLIYPTMLIIWTTFSGIASTLIIVRTAMGTAINDAKSFTDTIMRDIGELHTNLSIPSVHSKAYRPRIIDLGYFGYRIYKRQFSLSNTGVKPSKN
ncbi:hypothetical protein L218DRAFT_950756 [Marasmius fiardii PR-910]|nr:hypothetical protein L218DRAFT_950756 [Marasmius fiardii PR-910]